MVTATPQTPVDADPLLEKKRDLLTLRRQQLSLRNARTSLSSFSELMPTEEGKPYKLGTAFRIVTAKIQAALQGGDRFIILNLPRRHGKSLAATVNFPAWAFGQRQDLKIICTSYNEDLAVSHSIDARNLVASDEYHAAFPDVRHQPGRAGQIPIPIERQAAHKWRVGGGGIYIAAGLLGTIVGKGFDILIIDDVHKNREEADSKRMRDKVWDAYRSVLRPAMNSETGIILIIMMRMHPDDLTGRILKLMESEPDTDQFTVISFSALAETDDDLLGRKQGEALHPERWSASYLRSLRATIGSYEWAAQYQQRPVLRGGNMFATDRIIIHDSLDDFPDSKQIRFWDLASTTKQLGGNDPDFTCGINAQISREDRGIGVEADLRLVDHLWVRDCVFGQWAVHRRDKKIIATALYDGAGVKVAVESVGAYKDAYETLKAILRGHRTVKKVTVSKDKVARAAPLEPIFEAGHVHFLRADWNGWLKDQLTDFPSGGHDDGPDALAGVYTELKRGGSSFGMA